MANISIASRCNRDCSYCFAMETLDHVDEASSFMSIETFRKTLDFLIRSQINEARLLGGEPTIHPRFSEFVDLALDCGMTVTIFSGGLIPNKVLEKLESIPTEQIGVLVNVIPPSEPTPTARDRQAEVFRRLGQRIVLGLNIDSPSVDLWFLLDLIAEYNLAPSIRLGLAHPILGGTNRYLHPRQYPEVGRRVAAFGLEALARGVQLGFDCGWVPCMFPDGALETLGKGPDEVGLRCNPIIDILPNGQTISCYPLANHSQQSLPMTHDAFWLRSEFIDEQKSDRAVMLYKECAACEWRARGECTGGCLAGSMRRLRSGNSSIPLHSNPVIAEKAGYSNSELLQISKKL
ncbi:MAG: radical SAM protein [Bryobacterales bacterium]